MQRDENNHQTVNEVLKEYIPTILENDSYIDEYIHLIQEKWQFKADKDKLRHTLELHYKDACLNDEATIKDRSRKVRGLDLNESNKWMWITSGTIAEIAKNIIKEIT